MWKDRRENLIGQGVPPKIASKLASYFGSLEEISDYTGAELLQIPGFGIKYLEMLMELMTIKGYSLIKPRKLEPKRLDE